MQFAVQHLFSHFLEQEQEEDDDEKKNIKNVKNPKQLEELRQQLFTHLVRSESGNLAQLAEPSSQKSQTQNKGSYWEFAVKLSVCEIHNECVRDLLVAPASQYQDSTKTGETLLSTQLQAMWIFNNECCRYRIYLLLLR